MVTEISVNRAGNFPCNRKPNFYRVYADRRDLATKPQPAEPAWLVPYNQGLKPGSHRIAPVVAIVPVVSTEFETTETTGTIFGSQRIVPVVPVVLGFNLLKQ